ncbi:MAG: N-6 DNA methylase [Gallionella sp.]|nr:N-6 DNA methylase [Gallionella sp.]
MSFTTEKELIAACVALITNVNDLSPAERSLVGNITPMAARDSKVLALRKAIQKGMDPLGDAFAELRSSSDRRSMGAVYTPLTIIGSMLRWLGNETTPARIVDPGAGSGRFILNAGRSFPRAQLVAVELDPLAALMLRANLHAAGMADRTTVIVDDYRAIELQEIEGVTAYIGNPPYVRHHAIGKEWKAWYVDNFAELGIRASALAGLHLHFFLKTRMLVKEGDVGVFITSAEWMDVNYGASLRNLLINELGGLALHVLEPTVEAFPGTATTAAITCFRVGEAEAPFRVRSVSTLPKLNGLSSGTLVERDRLHDSAKWSIIVRPTEMRREGDMELGELFRVHRGQVTGANSVWIAGEEALRLPERLLIPTVTKAKDLIMAGERLQNADILRRIVDIPPELEEFTRGERQRISAFLKWARGQGADKSYVAQHRKAWWSVGLKAPAPILCTYMARRSPQFTMNGCDARHINIAHGLYPREPIAPEIMTRIVAWLNENISVAAGRTYAGGLTKFEPKEIERLRMPRLEGFTE